jgi:glycosidase
MWVMLDIVPNHAGYFSPDRIHEMTFPKMEYYNSCESESTLRQQL